jgi:hypothetical protein
MSLRFGEKAARWFDNEFARFREFISASFSPDFDLGVTSQDGGPPGADCLRELDSTAWSAYGAAFLRCRPEPASVATR